MDHPRDAVVRMFGGVQHGAFRDSGFDPQQAVRHTAVVDDFQIAGSHLGAGRGGGNGGVDDLQIAQGNAMSMGKVECAQQEGGDKSKGSFHVESP